MNLVCPKCHEDLRSYERLGVTIEQCSGCRGVFLDRGELERLMEAESRQYETYRVSKPEHAKAYGHHGSGRRKSFLSDLFD